MDRRDAAKATGLVIGYGLHDLLAGIHDERSHPGNGLADGPGTQDQHVQLWMARFLDRTRGDGQGVTRLEDGQLARLDRSPFRPDGPLPCHHVEEGVVVSTPRDGHPSPRAQGRVDQGHRAVGGSRTGMARDVTSDHTDERATVGR